MKVAADVVFLLGNMSHDFLFRKPHRFCRLDMHLVGLKLREVKGSEMADPYFRPLRQYQTWMGFSKSLGA